jgi:hypothetical protein
MKANSILNDMTEYLIIKVNKLTLQRCVMDKNLAMVEIRRE